MLQIPNSFQYRYIHVDFSLFYDKTLIKSITQSISLINYLFSLSSAHFKPQCKVKGIGTKGKKAKTKSD